jgi:hypothetical protein
VYALFVDIMGFAWAIESLTDEEHDSLRNQLTHPEMFFSGTDRSGQLAQRYWRFHNAIRAIYRPSWLSGAYISFSDSVVLAVDTWPMAEKYAIDLVHQCFKDEVPVRIGIGYGTFARLTFSVSTDPAGALSAEAPFYGSSIVRAYNANEADSCKGFRIILHPSVAASISRPAHVIVPLASDEVSDDCSHELNLLFNHRTGGYNDSKKYFKRLKRMRQGVTHPRPLKHYDQTEVALKHLQRLSLDAIPGATTPKKERS